MSKRNICQRWSYLSYRTIPRSSVSHVMIDWGTDAPRSSVQSAFLRTCKVARRYSARRRSQRKPYQRRTCFKHASMLCSFRIRTLRCEQDTHPKRNGPMFNPLFALIVSLAIPSSSAPEIVILSRGHDDHCRQQEVPGAVEQRSTLRKR